MQFKIRSFTEILPEGAWFSMMRDGHTGRHESNSRFLAIPRKGLEPNKILFF